MHNETVNVWTHLIAFLVMACLLVATMALLSPHGMDRLDLDVVLQQAPAPCEGIEGAALQQCLAAAEPSSPSPPSPPGTAAPVAGEDPMEVLHRLLGESEG